jgi:hypothetical protein
MGNRGILHDAQGVLGPARWRHKNWVTCVLSFKNRRRRIMAPGKYTELFFCDEAVAFAAGHRPCAECRRADFLRFAEAWRTGHGLAGSSKAGELDDALHRTRVTRDKRQVRTSNHLSNLPDGTFVSLPEEPRAAWLVWKGHLHRWSHEGYGDRRPKSGNAVVTVLTPKPTMRALGGGYVPAVHSTVV